MGGGGGGGGDGVGERESLIPGHISLVSSFIVQTTSGRTIHSTSFGTKQRQNGTHVYNRDEQRKAAISPVSIDGISPHRS